MIDFIGFGAVALALICLAIMLALTGVMLRDLLTDIYRTRVQVRKAREYMLRPRKT